MVERIDYGQEASLSKVRHEHSVIKDRRRVHYCRTGCWCLQGHSHPAVIMLRPTPIPNHVAVCWESSIQGLTTMNRRHSSKGGNVKSLQSMPTSVRMELNAPFFLKWALCIDDTSLLSPLTARWFGISPPDTVLTDFLSGDTMVSFLSYNVPPCRP